MDVQDARSPPQRPILVDVGLMATIGWPGEQDVLEWWTADMPSDLAFLEVKAGVARIECERIGFLLTLAHPALIY